MKHSIVGINTLLASLLAAQLATAQQVATPQQPVPPMPPGVADPASAIADPVYKDPVFWWRMSSVPKDVYEPDPYFYWPAARVVGEPGPWLPAAAPGRTTLPAAGLEAAEIGRAHV